MKRVHLPLGVVAGLIITTAALDLSVASAETVTTGPVKTAPRAHPFKLGALQLTALGDGTFVIAKDGKVFGGDVGPAVVAQALAGAKAPSDRITLSVSALLVRSGKRLALLDTGLGAANTGVLLDSLRATGTTPARITDIFITHTHGDHVGGLVDADGKLVFPHAKVHMAPAEWDWLRSKSDEAKLAAALKPVIKPVKAGEEAVPGIRAVSIEGHTPGHLGYELHSGDAKLLDIGDMAHSSIVSLAHPEWTMGFDSDSAKAKASRTEWLGKLADSHELIFAPHFPFPGVGYVIRNSQGFAFEPHVP